jgi:hypothetical protein
LLQLVLDLAADDLLGDCERSRFVTEERQLTPLDDDCCYPTVYRSKRHQLGTNPFVVIVNPLANLVSEWVFKGTVKEVSSFSLNLFGEGMQNRVRGDVEVSNL